jgi:dTDP-4-amino-4,6-dideoxygalactose transaminase
MFRLVLTKTHLWVKKYPSVKKFILNNFPNSFKRYVGVFPVQLSNERKLLRRVLHSGDWNMSYGRHPIHVELENEFASYIGTAEAVAVSGGGAGIQMALRALGLDRNSEVLMQVDTCSAVPMAALNAQTIPRFYDADVNTFHSNRSSIDKQINSNSKAIIGTHLWGNSDCVESLLDVCATNNLYFIEDACLALGTKITGAMAGSFGKVGVFSFGSTKPIQAGEGGMLVTNDRDLARELRSMRHWGERTKDYGYRDVQNLSWNGRISEFSAAVALGQLKGYPILLEKIREHVKIFAEFLHNETPDIELNFGNSLKLSDSSFTQAVLTLKNSSPKKKSDLMSHLNILGITAFHANFEPIPTLSLFKSQNWTKWVNGKNLGSNLEIDKNEFHNAFDIFSYRGIGIARKNFQSKFMLKRLIKGIQSFDYNSIEYT